MSGPPISGFVATSDAVVTSDTVVTSDASSDTSAAPQVATASGAVPSDAPAPRHGAASGFDATSEGSGATSEDAIRASGVSMRHLLDGLQGTDICIFLQDTDLVYQWVENPPAGFENILVGRNDADVDSLREAAQIATMKARLLETGLRQHEMVEVVVDRRRRSFDMVLEPHHDGRGTLVGFLGFAIEVTERLAREERLRVLLREVSHRSRNLLAIVQSIASQTVRTASAPSRFLERFNERLQSLAHTLDLVTVSEWEGATVHQLVSRQAGPFVTDTGVIEIAGPDPVLTPNAALHLGLAVQELASNASNHGIWSRHDGMVYARTRLEDGTLVFEWTEAGLDAQAPDIPKGSFGARTLTAIVPAAVGGTATVLREGSRFVYRLTIPADNFEL